MTLAELRPWLADAMVVVGVLVLTTGVYGLVTMPDVYTKLHAVSKIVVFGIVLLVLSSVVTTDFQIIARAILIAAVLLLTTPVSAHIIMQAAIAEHERMYDGSSSEEDRQTVATTQPESVSDGG